MKKIYLIIIGVLILTFVGVFYFINHNKQDEVLVSAINSYLEKNNKILDNDTIIITTTNNLKEENVLNPSYENNLIKITYKNKNIKYEILDNYRFEKENYKVVSTSNANVDSKSLFYTDTNYKYYLDDSKNYFIKQNNILISLYDIINNNYMTKEELINILPLYKKANILIDNNNENREELNNSSNKDNNNDNKNNNSDSNNNDNTINNVPNENGGNIISKPNNDIPDNNQGSNNNTSNNNESDNNINIPEKNEENKGDKEDNNVNNDFIIDDRNGKYCAQVIDEFWRDRNGVYYFTCLKSSGIYIVFKNGEEYTLKDALSKGKVTISELKSKGLGFLTKKIQYEER